MTNHHKKEKVLMYKYVLDTNTCIYIAKKKPTTVFAKFSSTPSSEMCLSVITYGELLYGVHKSKHSKRSLAILKDFIAIINVISLNNEVAKYYGKIRASLSQKGQIIGNNDLWIGAHALSMDSILVSNNLGEFSRIEQLKVQNWASQ